VRETRWQGERLGVRTSRFHRFGETTSFQIYTKYSVLRNGFIPFYLLTEHKNGWQA
jgi:hypothetical protein